MKPNRRDRLRMKTVAELEAMLEAVKSDPDSKIGAVGINMYNLKASALMDDITWAIYSKTGGGNRVMKTAPPELKNW